MYKKADETQKLNKAQLVGQFYYMLSRVQQKAMEHVADGAFV